MPTKFTDFMAELKREAKVEGPKAVAELKDFRERFRLARRSAKARGSEGGSLAPSEIRRSRKTKARTLPGF